MSDLVCRRPDGSAGLHEYAYHGPCMRCGAPWPGEPAASSEPPPPPCSGASLHRRWVVRYWPAGDEGAAKFHVCEDRSAAVGVRRQWATAAGFDADLYELVSPSACPRCDADESPCGCDPDEEIDVVLAPPRLSGTIRSKLVPKGRLPMPPTPDEEP